MQRCQLLRKSLQRLDIGCRPTSIDLDIVTLGPPELSKFFPKPRDPGLCFRIVLGKRHQDTDTVHLLGLLGANHERPSHRRASYKRDEVAPSHGAPPYGPTIVGAGSYVVRAGNVEPNVRLGSRPLYDGLGAIKAARSISRRSGATGIVAVARALSR